MAPVLVGTDFSESSLDAVTVARRLSRRRGGLLLAHVVPNLVQGNVGWGAVPVGTLNYPEVLDVRQAESHLREWAERTGVDALAELTLHGEPAQALADAAQEHRAGLVVVGATGAGRVERALLGTTASALLKQAHVPVLVVRGRPEPFRHIAVATDFSEASAQGARLAFELAREENARLSLVHVRDRTIAGQALEPENAEPELTTFNRDHLGGEAQVALIEGRPADALRDWAREHQVDLLVSGSHGPGLLERLLLGTTASALAERAPCSVLIWKG